MFSITGLLVLTTAIVLTKECPDGYVLDIDPILEKQNIEWTPCPGETAPNRECGSFKVPLDYTQVTPGVLTLQVARLPADTDLANGDYVFFNPGGPGEPALDEIGEDQLDASGRAYHIVTFDPRGTGLSIPYSCPTLQKLESYVTPNNSNRPIDEPNGLSAEYILRTEQGAMCAKTEYRELGQLIGTSFVARDIAALFDILDEECLIRYMGFSYGTVLGVTLAAMFPDRIERMVLDGNINPTDYYHGYNDESISDHDHALLYYFETCAKAGIDHCMFAYYGDSSEELQVKFYELIEGARWNPMTIPGNTILYDYREIKFMMYNTLFGPPFSWKFTAQRLAYLYQNLTGLPGDLDFSDIFVESEKPGEAGDTEETETTSGDEIFIEPFTTYAITCSDWDDIPGTLSDWQDWLKLYEERSEWGKDQMIEILYTCAQWQLNARGKYNGTFTNITTLNPILFVNGQYDLGTPLASALNSSSGFLNSAVLHHGGVGHCSTADPSNCTQAKIKFYWETGEIPDVSEICPPNKDPWTKETIKSSWREMGRRRRDLRPRYSLPPLEPIPTRVVGVERATTDNATSLYNFPEYPSTCTPYASKSTVPDDDDKAVNTAVSGVVTDPGLQKGLDDLSKICLEETGNNWFLSLICSALE